MQHVATFVMLWHVLSAGLVLTYEHLYMIMLRLSADALSADAVSADAVSAQACKDSADIKL